mmetsp:Transcript_22125/g.48362  ORF Transcript_22125/g.48362 Transcript_22125/m.48362 type:complete len:232 (-) Transcript_22125:607-1302(-)
MEGNASLLIVLDEIDWVVQGNVQTFGQACDDTAVALFHESIAMPLPPGSVFVGIVALVVAVVLLAGVELLHGGAAVLLKLHSLMPPKVELIDVGEVDTFQGLPPSLADGDAVAFAGFAEAIRVALHRSVSCLEQGEGDIPLGVRQADSRVLVEEHQLGPVPFPDLVPSHLDLLQLQPLQERGGGHVVYASVDPMGTLLHASEGPVGVVQRVGSSTSSVHGFEHCHLTAIVL